MKLEKYNLKMRSKEKRKAGPKYLIGYKAIVLSFFLIFYFSVILIFFSLQFGAGSWTDAFSFLPSTQRS
jgi:hypothetical protein